jgi:4-amino-4-deoxy-L-arabinose transferase-like glycosyltransferase
MEGGLLRKVDVKDLAVEWVPLVVILFGVACVALSLGPYSNWDSQLEFEASQNAFKIGVPYVESFGAAIDQPPLGFYTEAAFYTFFGASINTVVVLVTLIGVGSTVLVYLLGKEFYGKVAGLVAAALFGLNPWHLVLSRSALIDVQCLFLSLLSLLLGLLAIRRGSVKITLAAGIVFSLAFLTKFYAVYMLIPLLLFYIYSRPKNPKQIISQIAAFGAPSFAFAFLWYQIFLGRSLLSVFQHNDLIDVIPVKVNVVASPFFATNFLLNYGLGVFFIAAAAFSLLISFSLRKRYSKTVPLDLIWLGSIAFVIVVNVVLGFVWNLNVPYFSAVKYLYQALPYCALLVASLTAKGIAMLSDAKSTGTLRKELFYLITAVAAVLIVLSLTWSIYNTNYVSTSDYLQYRVESGVDYGYALLNPTPLNPDSPLMSLQYFGFGAVLFGFSLVAMINLAQKHQTTPPDKGALSAQN